MCGLLTVTLSKLQCLINCHVVVSIIIIIIVIIRPRRSHSAVAYSCQTFPWTICRTVRTYVHRSVGLSSALWKNGGSDPDAVWHRRLDRSTHEAGSGV